MTSDTPYHEGELAVQSRAGLREAARTASEMLQSRLPVRSIPFVRQQALAVVGSLDADGEVWASVLFGKPGFLRVVDDRTLMLDRSVCHSTSADPVWENLKGQANIGLLLIELETRRRLRINGHVRQMLDDQCLIAIERAYPNCPKYIQRRRLTIAAPVEGRAAPLCRQGQALDADCQAWIKNADTFFVASAHPERGIDASHRGGRPGFVKVVNSRRLRVPDFPGNNMFNTLGNFVSYPHAGLVFIDFDRGRLLQLAGRPELLWDQPDEAGETGGTARYWGFGVESWRVMGIPLHLEWHYIDSSPFIPSHGKMETQTDTSPLRLTVERIWVETDKIKGFQLCASDGGELPVFEAGAHLPVRVRDNQGDWVVRHYSLLSDPADRTHYRIGVLAELTGRGGSLYLHESVREGDTLEALPAKNGFPLKTDAEHCILLGGGIGITPLIAMLYVLKASGRSFELHYSAKRFSDLAFRQDIERLAGARAHFYASKEPNGTRLDLQRILNTPVSGMHVYACGPRSMIDAVRDLAHTNGWSPGQIHFESFGASPAVDDRALTVTLAKSGMTVHVPASRSILDALLENGVAVPYDCKRGECSLCVTRVLEGDVEHRDLCLTDDMRKEAMCLCVSRAKTGRLTLDL